jgi:hypothetical protein
MRFEIELRCVGDDCEEVHPIATLERDGVTAETLGLTLAEGKAVLKSLQEVMVEQPLQAYVEQQRQCPQCALRRTIRGYHTLRFRTAFGTVRVNSPRLNHCDCQAHEAKTFSPLAELLSEHTTPQLLFLETKWASLMSYGMTADLLKDTLPIDETLSDVVIRNHVHRVAERMEQRLGEERHVYIDGCERDWGQLPIPDGPLTVGIDGGFVRARGERGHFEVIAGKSMLAFRRDEPEEADSSDTKCFAFVQTFDEKPRRRLFELLKSQGLQESQQITFLTDGGEDVRNLPLYLSPQAEHLIDWFHITMKLTVLRQSAKGLRERTRDEDDQERELCQPTLDVLESIKWYLWHGNVFQATKHLDLLEEDLAVAADILQDERTPKLLGAVEEFHVYIDNNQDCIPNYGERYRQGETITTAFVESTVNQVISKRMVKRQQMQWSRRGAHLLLQTRTQVLNDQLEETFREWYPKFRTNVTAVPSEEVRPPEN